MIAALLATMLVSALGTTGAGATGNTGCANLRNSTNTGDLYTVKYSQAGSCKQVGNQSGIPDANITCGSTGRVLDAEFDVMVNSREIEACSSSGSEATHGQLLIEISSTHGVRIVLNSDKDQPAGSSKGFIKIQSGPTNAGIWCSIDGDNGDGYGTFYATSYFSPVTKNMRPMDSGAQECRPE